MDIQWYPGHMNKAKRLMRESLPLVDLVVEIVDARIPASSRNPDFNALFSKKQRIVILNKADMADPEASSLWERKFREQGIYAMSADSRSGKMSGFSQLVLKALSDKIERYKQRGMVNPPIRMMVAGIPNSGKSTFINRMSRSNKAQAEDRPGVTRQNRWFVTKDGFEMLDTPGVLWPKFKNNTVALHLAFTGAIKDQILDLEGLACGLLAILLDDYPKMLIERYKLTDDLPQDNFELLKLIGRQRGMLMPGGVVDTERAAVMLLDEFRGGKIGRITLERP